jgi:hypothetical protein
MTAQEILQHLFVWLVENLYQLYVHDGLETVSAPTNC